MDKFILKAIEASINSDHRHKMGAVIFNKKRLLSIGRNYSLKSVKHLHPKYTRWPGSIHAEVDAIIKAKRPLKGCSILVIRINCKGKLMLAKPCPHCMNYISHVGIKYIYYSDSNGNIQKIKL